MNILYSDLKSKDYTIITCQKLARDFKVKGIICDFDPDYYLKYRLALTGITENYYRMKLYDKPTIEQIEAELKKAKECGFKGFAFDLEAYSGSDVWEKRDYAYYLFEKQVWKIIKNYFDKIVIYPEYLGGKKYKYYFEAFRQVDAVFPFKTTVLMERTYNVWKPWELLYFYLRAKNDFKRQGIKVNLIIGIWQESLPWPAQIIQSIFTKPFTRFYYSETKTFINSRWLKFLS